jgi:hypothetical protein
MEPISLLYPISIISNADMLERDGGIAPVKLLPDREKNCSLDNSPIHDGISPLKSLNVKDKCRNR